MKPISNGKYRAMVHAPSARRYEWFTSGGDADLVNQMLSAMCPAVGGHVDKPRERGQ